MNRVTPMMATVLATRLAPAGTQAHAKEGRK